MAFTNRTKISEYDATAANNINLGTAASPAARLGEYGVDLDAEAMRPSDTNGALRELMKHLKDMDAGTSVLTSPKAGQFLFDTTYTETGSEPQGSAYWNSDEETLDLVQNGAVLQLGQETQIHVRNNSATVTITNGTAVMAVGTVGASGRIKVDPMDADDATTPGPKYFLGIATEDILGGSDGKVTVFGKVRSLNTSTYSEGDVLWCDPVTPGALTATTPSAPDLKIAAGYVVTSDLNNGVIFVRANAGIDLHENHRVQILSPDAGGNPQTDKMLLCWNNTAKRWENKTATDAGIFEGGVVINESGDAVNFRVESDTNSNMISVSGINNEVGIGRSPNGYELDIQGSLRTSANAYITGTLSVLGNTTLGSDSADDITVNGVFTNGAQIYDGVGDVKVGYRNIPIVAATTVGATHVGKCLTASTTVTVPNSTMAAGDVVSIFNNSASGITLTLNPTLAYVNGADAASATLSAYGVATVLFIDSTTCVITGNVS